MNNYTQILETAIRAAVLAGNRIQNTGNAWGLNRKRKESFRDITTQADTYAEAIIISEIQKKSRSPILSEESGIIGKLGKNKNYWVVDPLDGTVNYSHNIPLYATSIAYLVNNIPAVGVIYNPSQNELFYGAEGIGVYKNHNNINIIDRKPEESLFSIAFSGKKHVNNNRVKEFINFQKINDLTMGCLRTGSAALNLAYLAEGRFGGCIGKYNKIWDVSAGLVIAKLAGAIINYRYKKGDKSFVSYSAVVPKSESFIRSINIW